MSQIIDVRSNPLGLLEQPLSRRHLDRREIVEDHRLERQAIPRHGHLPAEAEPVRDLFAGQTFGIGERRLEPSPQRLTQL